MKKLQLIIAISLLCLSNLSYAQGGSLYTRYGVGDLINQSSARIQGMGGLGYALPNSDFLSDLNPANWSRIYTTRLEANFLLNGVNLNDGFNKSTYFKGIFNGIKLGVPIERDLGISLVLGVSPETFVQYEIVNNKINTGVENYTTTYKGEGGISKAFIGASANLGYDFVLGASFDYYIGLIKYTSSIEYEQNSDFKNSSIRKENEYRGIGFNVGLLSPDLSGIINSEKVKNLRLGIAFKYVSNLNTDTLFYKGSLLGEKLIERKQVYTHIPYKVGLGLSFVYNQNYLFILDYATQPFSKYTFNSIHSNNLRDYHKLSVGFEHRNIVSRYSTFWQQIILRGGLGYEQTQYKINGTGIDFYYLSTGLSFPLMYENTVDLGFVIGIKGKKDNNLIKETVYNLSVTLNFGELWFIRQER